MNSLLRRHGGGARFLQLGLELGWIVAAVVLAVKYHSDDRALPSLAVVAPALVFALLMVGLNAAFGLYRHDRHLPFGEYVLREVAAVAIGLPIAYIALFVLPDGVVFQRAFVPAVVIAFVGLVAVRQAMVSPLARAIFAPPRAGARYRSRGADGRNIARHGEHSRPGAGGVLSAREGCCKKHRLGSHRLESSVSGRNGEAPAHRRDHRRRARTAWRRAPAARIAGLPPRRRSGYQPAAIFRTRAPACPDRLAQGELAHLWQWFSSKLAACDREAHFRHRRRGRAAADRAAAHGRLRVSDLVRWWRADHLSAGEGRPPRTDIHVAQVPQHDQGCRAERAGVVGEHQRRTRDSDRTRHAPYAHRRVAAADQRPQGRNELCRPAAGASARSLPCSRNRFRSMRFGTASNPA